MIHNYTGNKLDKNFIKILDVENHKQQKIMNMTLKTQVKLLAVWKQITLLKSMFYQ